MQKFFGLSFFFALLVLISGCGGCEPNVAHSKVSGDDTTEETTATPSGTPAGDDDTTSAGDDDSSQSGDDDSSTASSGDDDATATGDDDATAEQYVDNDGDHVTTKVDCDDTDASVYPTAPEVCDGKDNDCDGDTDEEECEGTPEEPTATPLPTTVDGDGDGYSEVDGDCDNANASVYPGAPEACDSVDNDCDGQTDDGCATPTPSEGDDDATSSATPTPTSDADADGDGFEPPLDCDDGDATVYPGATETCNGIDDDCDGTVDDDAGCVSNTIACSKADDGMLEVLLTGDFEAGLMHPLDLDTGDAVIGLAAWDDGGDETSTAYLGSGEEHTLLIERSDFTPFADNGEDFEWFDLRVWQASGVCQVVDDGGGGLVVEYSP